MTSNPVPPLTGLSTDAASFIPRLTPWAMDVTPLRGGVRLPVFSS